MNFFRRYGQWIMAAWIAFVFLQSLFFKFLDSPETQYIFGVLGATFGLPWFAAYGAYIVGIAELFASVLLFTRFWAFGALLALGIMSGAIVFHLFTPLGIVMPAFDSTANQVGNDGGTLFVMACITWGCALILILKDWASDASQIRSVLLHR